MTGASFMSHTILKADLIMASSKSSDENLDEIRETYYERIKTYFSDQVNNRDDLRKWGSQLWINYMIRKIKQKEMNELNAKSYRRNLPYIPDTLGVTSKDGKEILVKKIKIVNEEYQVQVVPWEESFDIIQQAHDACNHGDIETTKHTLLKEKLCVNINCLNVFINLCIRCNNPHEQKTHENQNKLIFNRAGIFQVVDMTSLPDGQFCHILVYGDMETKLTQLRGLTQNSDIEIAMELFKIFMDLGPPKTLVVRKGENYANIIKIINKLCHPCKITLEERADIFDKSSQIKSLIHKWTIESKNNHWEVGCHAVQWKINNVRSTTRSPYQIVFASKGSREKLVFKKSCNPDKPVTKNLQIEEDLGIYKGEDMEFEIEDSIASSEPEVFEENWAEMNDELESQHIGSENRNAGSIAKSVDLVSIETEADPLEPQLEGIIDTQKYLDPLETFKSDEMEQVNIKNNIWNKWPGNTYERNEENTENAFKSENSTNNCENLIAGNNMLMDIEELNNGSISNVDSGENKNTDVAQTLCNECKMIILTKSYICMTCLKYVHLYCSERVTGVLSVISQVIYLSCVSKQREKTHKE